MAIGSVKKLATIVHMAIVTEMSEKSLESNAIFGRSREFHQFDSTQMVDDDGTRYDRTWARPFGSKANLFDSYFFHKSLVALRKTTGKKSLGKTKKTLITYLFEWRRLCYCR